MTYQTNHLKLPVLSFLGVLCLPKKLYQGWPFRKESQGLQHEKTKRSQYFLCGPLCLSVVRNAKQSQISSFSIEYRVSSKKQIQIDPSNHEKPNEPKLPPLDYGPKKRNEAKPCRMDLSRRSETKPDAQTNPISGFIKTS